MNLLYFSILLVIGAWLWSKSELGFFSKNVWVSLAILAAVWILVFGQFAIADSWWTYGKNYFVGFRIGAIPAIDLFYFFAGIGWSLYFGKKLKIFD